jgi:surfeit locus 1 family protein
MTEARSRAQARFPVGLTVTVAICFAILVGLGVWQLQRLKWKEGILAHVAALQSARPVPIGPVLERAARGADVDFTRVSAVCPGLATARFLPLYSIHEGGQAGWRLISACPVETAAYRTILVDRGFVSDTVAARPPVDPAAAAPVRVTGILRKPDRPSFVAPKNRPGRWFFRDIPAMARALGAPAPAPVFLYAETSSNPGFQALEPAPLPANIPNRHLEYALTWFGLAAALLGVYVAALFGRVRS